MLSLVIKHSNGLWKSMHNLYNHIKAKTCFKSCFKSSNGRCIDLFLSNKKHYFIKAKVFETGLSDYHLLIYNILRTQYIKLPPKVNNYRCYKKFNPEIFIY